MNLYATVADVQAEPGMSGESASRVLSVLESASRDADLEAGREFFTKSETRYFDVRGGDRIYVDDFLSLSSVGADSELDDTFDGETWVADTDFVAGPEGVFPKTYLQKLRDGDYWAASGRDRYLKIAGTWGHGDGVGASPWAATGKTGTVANGTGTTLTLSESEGVSAGQTLLIESEQLFVTAVSGTDATVERGVNGTTGAAHSGAAISVAMYPEVVKRAVIYWTMALLREASSAGYVSERIGDWSYKLAGSVSERVFARCLGSVRRTRI